jgi:hypothetical protein
LLACSRYFVCISDLMNKLTWRKLNMSDLTMEYLLDFYTWRKLGM